MINVIAATSGTAARSALTPRSFPYAGKPLADAPSVQLVGAKDGRVILQIGSGIYRFTSTLAAH